MSAGTATRWRGVGPKFIDVSSNAGRTVRAFFDLPCICGANRPLGACCARGGTVDSVHAGSSTSPHGPLTGHANPRCYARALHDCEVKTTREHYFSRGVTRALAGRGTGETIRVLQAGHPARDLPPDQVLQANILCRRHNSALSALDVAGERLISALLNALMPCPLYPLRQLPGCDVERWLLKASCGLLAVEGEEVPLAWLRMLFGYDEVSAPLGLYMHVALGRRMHAQEGAQFGFYRRDGHVKGSEVSLDAIRLTLDLTGDGRVARAEDAGAVRVHRPNGIWFDRGGATKFFLSFAWAQRSQPDHSVVVEVID